MTSSYLSVLRGKRVLLILDKTEARFASMWNVRRSKCPTKSLSRFKVRKPASIAVQRERSENWNRSCWTFRHGHQLAAKAL
jgi:hypothetical protein